MAGAPQMLELDDIQHILLTRTPALNGLYAFVSFRDAAGGRAWLTEMLDDTGPNHPDTWVGGLASDKLHAIGILFARDAAERARCVSEHQKLLAQCPGVEMLSTLELEATPPFDYPHDHFGYRDRLSQ